MLESWFRNPLSVFAGWCKVAPCGRERERDGVRLSREYTYKKRKLKERVARWLTEVDGLVGNFKGCGEKAKEGL